MGAVCVCGDKGDKGKEQVVEAVPVEECFGETAPQLAKESPEAEKLIVTIVGVRNLRGEDWLPGNGKPDCYCELKSEGLLLHATACLPNTVEPAWREEFTVAGVASGSALTFVVCDKDKDSADTLGKATLESKDYEKDGFNGELQLKGAGTGQAKIRVKVKLEGATLPPYAPAEFAVTAEKASKDKSFGLGLDPGDGITLHVMAVSEGPFTDFNKGVAPELRIGQDDVIASVNGVKGDSDEMLKEFTQKLKVECRVKKTAFTTIVFDTKADDKIGLELPEDMQGEALVVRGIYGGAAGKHNQSARPADKLYKGDRIISVGGVKGSAATLKEQLVTQKGPTQLVIRRVAVLEPEAEGSDGHIHWLFA